MAKEAVRDPVDAREADLLAQVGAGDRGAPLDDLYDRYARRVYALGLRWLGDGGLAEDLVQETFVRLWRAAGRFDPARGSVRTYLFTIARRAAADLWRTHSRHQATSLDAPGGPGESLRGEQGESFDRVVLEVDMGHALDGLSPKHREVLELHFREDLTQPQIAERLDLPLGTVKTRVFYALRSLRDLVGERP